MISFTKAVRNFYVKAFNFKGRATRAEYWWAYLYMLLLVVIYSVLFFIIVDSTPNNVNDSVMILTCILIFLMLPKISLIVRRLHDLGDSAWGLLLCCIPIVRLGFQVALGVQPSDDDNKYGPKIIYEIKKSDNKGFWSWIIILLCNGSYSPFADRTVKPFATTDDNKFRIKETYDNKKNNEVEMPK